MKLRTIIKIAVTSSVVLLCTGFVMFYFFKLSAAAGRRDFNLYTLVPESAVMVFETDNLAGFVQDINELSVSKANHFLHASRLFSYLKQHLSTLLEDTPHGLSRQMNKVLISFHEPDNDMNQVLYCCLGEGDRKRVEDFIVKYISSWYPSKTFSYKGENIFIYPVSDGQFLSCYLADDFVVLSYQKKLIEQVIDARVSDHSLMQDSLFTAVRMPEKSPVAAGFYVRMPAFEGKSMTDSGYSGVASPGGWVELEMKMKGDIIYFTGTAHDCDTFSTYVDVLRRQQPVQGFPGKLLPASTFSFSKRSTSELHSMLHLLSDDAGPASTGKKLDAWDEALARYLQENGGTELVTCLFEKQVDDTLSVPVAVVSIPMTDVVRAERIWRHLLAEIPRGEVPPASGRQAFCYTSERAYPLYYLRDNNLFLHLSGIGNSFFQTVAAFYDGRLLLASDAEGLCSYIRSLEAGEVLEGAAVYEEGKNTLADAYTFMMMADFSNIREQSDRYVRLVPGFFLRHAGFFRHFIFFVQFVCTDGAVCPNIVLLYKGE